MRKILSIQLPDELMTYVRSKAADTFTSVGSVIRSAIVLDRAMYRTPQHPAMTEDDGNLVSTRRLRTVRKGGTK